MKKTLFCAIGLCVGFCGCSVASQNAVANSKNLSNNSNFAEIYLSKNNIFENQITFNKETLKEFEKYDKNLYNIPKTEQEKVKLEKLIKAIMSANYGETKEILDKNSNLINLNLSPFVTPTSAYFYSIMKFSDENIIFNSIFQGDKIIKGKVFDEKIFELLMSYNPKLYTNDLIPFMVVMNKNISDNKTAKIIQKMIDEEMNANLQYFDTPKQLIEASFDADKINTTELLLQYNSDERICLSLQMSSGTKVGMFFGDENSIFKNKNKPLNDKQIALANSPEFLALKNRQLDFTEKIIKNYCSKDLNGLVSYEMVLKRLNDTKNLERLQKLGYKKQLGD